MARATETEKLLESLLKAQKQTNEVLENMSDDSEASEKRETHRPVKAIKPTLFVTGKRSSQSDYIAARGAVAIEKLVKAHAKDKVTAKKKGKKSDAEKKKDDAAKKKAEEKRFKEQQEAQEDLIQAVEGGFGDSQKDSDTKYDVETKRAARAAKKRLKLEKEAKEQAKKDQGYVARVMDATKEAILKNTYDEAVDKAKMLKINIKSREEAKEDAKANTEKIGTYIDKMSTKNEANMTHTEKIMAELIKNNEYNLNGITSEMVDTIERLGARQESLNATFQHKWGKDQAGMKKDMADRFKKSQQGTKEQQEEFRKDLAEYNNDLAKWGKDSNQIGVDIGNSLVKLSNGEKVSRDLQNLLIDDINEQSKIVYGSLDRLHNVNEEAVKATEEQTQAIEDGTKQLTTVAEQGTKAMVTKMADSDDKARDLQEEANEIQAEILDDAKAEYRDNFLTRMKEKAMKEKTLAALLGLGATMTASFKGLSQSLGNKLSGLGGKAKKGAEGMGMIATILTTGAGLVLMKKLLPKILATKVFSSILGKVGLLGIMTKLAKTLSSLSLKSIGLLAITGDILGALGIAGVGTAVKKTVTKTKPGAKTPKTKVPKVPKVPAAAQKSVGTVAKGVAGKVILPAMVAYDGATGYGDGELYGKDSTNEQKRFEAETKILDTLTFGVFGRKEIAEFFDPDNVLGKRIGSPSESVTKEELKKAITIGDLKTKTSGPRAIPLNGPINNSNVSKVVNNNQLAAGVTTPFSSLYELNKAEWAQKDAQNGEVVDELKKLNAKEDDKAKKIKQDEAKAKADKSVADGKDKSLGKPKKVEAEEAKKGIFEKISDFTKEKLGDAKDAAMARWHQMMGTTPSGGGASGTSVKNIPSHDGSGKGNGGKASMSMVNGGREITYPNGDKKSGGHRNWRNNNPGNMEAGGYADSNGSIGSDGRFAIFPTMDAGFKAQAKLISKGKNYKNLNLAAAISRYAPPSENNTAAYIAAVSSATGIAPGTPMSSLSEEQVVGIAKAMAQHEGTKVGTLSKGDGTATQVPTTTPTTRTLASTFAIHSGAAYTSNNAGLTASVQRQVQTAPTTSNSMSSGAPSISNMASPGSGRQVGPTKASANMGSPRIANNAIKKKSGSTLVNNARSYLGKGMTYSQSNRNLNAEGTPASMDCSSWVAKIVKETYGIPSSEFGTSTVPQFNYLKKNGTELSKGEESPGDFVAYGNTKTTTRHIAIASGAGQQLHMSSTGNGGRGGIKESAIVWGSGRGVRVFKLDPSQEAKSHEATESTVGGVMDAARASGGGAIPGAGGTGASASASQGKIQQAIAQAGGASGMGGTGIAGTVNSAIANSTGGGAVKDILGSVLGGQGGVGGILGNVVNSVISGGNPMNALKGAGNMALASGTNTLMNKGQGMLQEKLGNMGGLPFNNIMSQINGGKSNFNSSMLASNGAIGQGLGSIHKTLNSTGKDAHVPYKSEVSDGSLDILRGILGGR